MSIAGDTIMHLAPGLPRFSPLALMDAWIRADFRLEDCQTAFDAWVRAAHLPDSWFDRSQLAKGGLVATNALFVDAFRKAETWRWSFAGSRGRVRFDTDVSASDVPTIAALVRDLGKSASAADLLDLWSDNVDEDIRVALGSAFDDGVNRTTWSDYRGPGIYRREHASIVISSGETSILFDPQSMVDGWRGEDGLYPADRRTPVDAVVITHSHADHWHLPSVLRHCSHTTPVVVPHVPCPNLLTHEDFSDTLGLAGQPCKVLAWNDSLSIGDIRIESLPFFGEQPTRDGPAAPKHVRNWGNCYRVSCPLWSVFVLADSGEDPDGRMLDVIAESTRADGPVDAVVSCCESFPEGIFPGLSAHILAVPFSRLTEIHADLKADCWKSVTSGVSGVADICAISRARYFLPYAHGFGGIGNDVDHPRTRGRRLPGYVRQVRDLLAAREVRTKVVDWKPGDRFVPQR